MALAARGFGAPFRRTILHDIRYRPVDYILTGLMLVTLASLVVLRLV
jgi:energy-coupling factor transporter transmembrane protein EcfT